MIGLEPLQVLFDRDQGIELPLPPELAALYGRLAFPLHPGRPYVISNFVTTLDGVASLGMPGKEGGGEISGNNTHDRMVMGLLRAVSDAVIIGAGTLEGSPQHLWTSEDIFPSLEGAFQSLRTGLGKSRTPLNVIVTAHGEIDPKLPVFQSGKVSALIVTTPKGARRATEIGLPPSVQIGIAKSEDTISPAEILHEVVRASQKEVDLILVEGGPHLIGDFYAAHALDEQFLTLAPQVAGRNDSAERPGLVAGKTLAPESPTWGALIGVKRAASHLFLRYAFEERNK